MVKFDKEILLGSGSPRRRELLEMMGVDFKVIKIKDVDEVYPAGMPAEEVPVYLSRLKASAYRNELRPGQVLVTADTVVILDGKILGKPVDEAEAEEMLRRLSGHTHDVVTGVTLTTTEGCRCFSEKTGVTFCCLDDEEIKDYVMRFRPLDKAGAYGVQEWIGAVGVTGMSGCFYNVMGLPTSALYRELKELCFG